MPGHDPVAGELAERLHQIARRLTPCQRPDVEAGWDLCAHGLPWPCPTTEAAWIARGLDCDQQARSHRAGWPAGAPAGHSGAILNSGGTSA